MDLTTFNSNVATMSSLEIAKLTGTRHDSVRRSIETLFEKEVITLPQSVVKPSGGRSSKEYVFSGDKGKRDCIIVVAQLMPEFTAKIIDRWQELEAMQPKAFPKDYISALEAFVESQKEKARLELENSKLNTLIDNEFGYCSILRAACFLEVHETTFNWRVLKSHTTLLGLTIKRVPSPRFGYQNLYPLRAFRECYPQFDFDDLTPEKIDDKTSLALTQAAKAIKAAK